MKFVVTGGAGFIGSHLVEKLLSLEHEVIVIDNLSTGFESYLSKHNNLTFLKLDISDWNQLSRNFSYFKKVNGVFHFAAVARIQPSIFNPSLTHDTNVTGTLNILEIMRVCDIKKIVYSASSSYYGKTTKLPSKEEYLSDCQTPYAVSKYMGELYCKTWGKLHGIDNVCLRYFNVYGPRSPLEGIYAPVIGIFFRQTFINKPMTIVGNGEQKRDFTYVDDVIRANMLAMEKPNADGLSVNIGTGKNYTINQVAEYVKKHFPYAKTINIPERIGEAQASLADNILARELLGWMPKIDLESGITQLFEYFKKNSIYFRK